MSSTWDPSLGSDLVTQQSITDVLQSSYDKVDSFRINVNPGIYTIKFKFDEANDLGIIILSITKDNAYTKIFSVEGSPKNGDLVFNYIIPENYSFNLYLIFII